MHSRPQVQVGIPHIAIEDLGDISRHRSCTRMIGQVRLLVHIIHKILHICDRACENQLCERKLHRVIFSLTSFVPNALSHFRKLQKKAH